MKQEFLKVFNNYELFYKNPEQVTNVDLKQLLRYELPKKIQSLLNLDPKKYMVTGSYGQGNLTETPWIAIYERSITESAQQGFYVVFLFQKNMEGVYLLLNQGTKYLRKKFKGFKPIDKMKEVAEKINQELSFAPVDQSVSKIQLLSKQENARAYESANIQAKYYSKSSFPSNEQIIADVRVLLNNLEEIKKFIGTRTLDEVIDALIYKEEIEDAQFQEDVMFAEAGNTMEAPQPVSDLLKSRSLRGKWKRNAEKAKEALIKANYQCEIDSSHETFISPLTKKNFVEAHHLIPIARQDKFKYSLDVPGNIIALCPNCHRRIHHSSKKDKKDMIKFLYSQRKAQLRLFGIEVDINDLLKDYGI